MSPPQMHNLLNEIKEVLIVSIYVAAYGQGETVTEINSFRQRATLHYLNNAKFHHLIDMQSHAILDACLKFKNDCVESILDLHKQGKLLTDD